MQHFFRPVMSARISDTLAAIAEHHAPVPRTCHLGNNTANNWGWLALARNTYMLQFDHTLFGVDEVCVPWGVLADGGRFAAAYAPSGAEHPELAGQHVNDVLPNLPRKYKAHLNVGIFAKHENQDLITHHLVQARWLAQQMNGSEVTTDSIELSNLRDVVAPAVRALHRSQMLQNVFDRWVKSNRHGHLISHRIATVEYLRKERVSLRGYNQETFFTGDLTELIDRFFDAVKQIACRLISSRRPQGLSYPWLSLPFNYTVQVLKECQAYPAYTSFFHAGGSASSYYLNRSELQDRLNTLRGALADAGLVPANAVVNVVPTLAAQLFASCPRSEDALSHILTIWRTVLRHEDARHTVAQLGHLPGGDLVVGVVSDFWRGVRPETREMLASATRQFNDCAVHRLPVSHAANLRHGTYNKYGVCQRTLADVRPVFPSTFGEFSWGEAELLVRCIAQEFIYEKG